MKKDITNAKYSDKVFAYIKKLVEVEGLSQGKIAEKLMTQGYCGKNGRLLSQGEVSKFLTQPKYKYYISPKNAKPRAKKEAALVKQGPDVKDLVDNKTISAEERDIAAILLTDLAPNLKLKTIKAIIEEHDRNSK